MLYVLLLLLLCCTQLAQCTTWSRWNGYVSRAASVDPFTHDIYVVGETTKSFDGQPYLRNYDGFLVKFSANGTRIWSRLFGSQSDDFVREVQYDYQTGDVILCGTTYGSFGNQINTDPSGNTLDIFVSR
jgi:hypothetical protein